ncbi:hypothetical protein DIPPA_33788 [Diplonema papillatum]|nr:hypothetical protein DIPPA_33788 [Diplonema papillatum]
MPAGTMATYEAFIILDHPGASLGIKYEWKGSGPLYIVEIEKGSPVEAAGVRPGAVIRSIEGQAIPDGPTLLEVITVLAHRGITEWKMIIEMEDDRRRRRKPFFSREQQVQTYSPYFGFIDDPEVQEKLTVTPAGKISTGAAVPSTFLIDNSPGRHRRRVN